MANPYQAPAVEWAWALDGGRAALRSLSGQSSGLRHGYRPPATGVVVALGAVIAANVAAAAAHAQERGVLVAAAGGDEVNGLVAEASRRFVFFADGAVIVTTLVCAVFWALWTFRAAKNVGVLAPGAMSCSPAWSVGLLFLPLANLFMPLRVMFELFANSTSSERGDAYAVAIAWWVLCLLA